VRVTGAAEEGVVAGGLGGGVAALGGSVSVAGASNGGGSWPYANAAQQRTTPREPTILAHDIERLSRFCRNQLAVAKTHQYDTSVATGSGIRGFSDGGSIGGR
jgi:hypothetical protein